MNKLTIIGAGSMAEALLTGMIEQKFISPDKIWVTNRSNEGRLEALKKQFGIKYSYDRKQLLDGANVVILAMKPKDVARAMDEIKNFLKDDTLVISLLAGIKMDTIENLAEKLVPIARVMPNTSSAIGKSATAIAVNNQVTDEQKGLLKALFDTVGLTVFVEETQLDAVTGLSGSGPAYIYYLIEAMEKAAIDIGLEQQIAKDLIVQTLKGAAEMYARSEKTPTQLRLDVTSPGGTTEAGIHVLEANHVQETFIQCIQEAAKKSAQLGESLTKEISVMK